MLRSAHSWQWWWQWRLRMDVRISVLCMHRVLCMNVSIQFCLNMFVGNENCISLLWVLILTHCSKQWNDLPCMHGEHSKASTVSKSRCIGSNFNKRLQKQNFLARAWPSVHTRGKAKPRPPQQLWTTNHRQMQTISTIDIGRHKLSWESTRNSNQNSDYTPDKARKKAIGKVPKQACNNNKSE